MLGQHLQLLLPHLHEISPNFMFLLIASKVHLLFYGGRVILCSKCCLTPISFDADMFCIEAHILYVYVQCIRAVKIIAYQNEVTVTLITGQIIDCFIIHFVSRTDLFIIQFCLRQKLATFTLSAFIFLICVNAKVRPVIVIIDRISGTKGRHMLW